MRLAATATCVLAAVATVTFTAEASAADPAQLRSDLATALEQTFSAPGQPGLVYDSIDVAGQAAPFDVIIRGVRFGSAEEGFVNAGDVTLTVSPAGDGLYDISNLTIPTPIVYEAPPGADPGEERVTIDVGEQRFAGKWSMQMKSFLTFDGHVGDVSAKNGAGATVVTLGGVDIKGDTTDKGNNRWDQVASFTASDLKITSPEDGTQVTIGQLSAGTKARDIDLLTFQSMMDKIGAAGLAMEQGSTFPAPGDSGTSDPNASADQGGATAGSDIGTGPGGQMGAEQAQALQDAMQALQGIPASIGDAESTFALRGLSVRNESGAEVFKLDSGSLAFSVSDLDQEKSGMRFAYSHAGLDADWNVFNSDDGEFEFEFDTEGSLAQPKAGSDEAEKLDPQTEQLIDAFVPREFALDLRLSDVPSKQLWDTFVSTFYSSASEGGTGMEIEMMGMMLPMMLAQAGSTVSIVDTRYVSNTAALAINGDVKADPASMMGASGKLTLELTGLDKMIDLIKSNLGPDGAADAAPLEMLRAFGERTQADGQTVDRYVVTLEPNGALMVNGKDMNFLLGGMGGEQ